MLIAFAFGQFFDWRFVAFRTILAGGNPKFPALVALDPDAVLVYPAVLYFADAVRHGSQICALGLSHHPLEWRQRQKRREFSGLTLTFASPV